MAKLTEEEWEKKRADTKLGFGSMLQGIDQLLRLGVLANEEKNQLDTVGMHLENLIHYYEIRSEKSKEEYCDAE